jgi:hypothetical protein
VITQVLGRINKMHAKVGKIQCLMMFMVIDTNSYNLLLGLGFLIKIGTIINMEKGMIQLRQ